MLTAVPPLWKDIDAYLQVTLPPNLDSLVHYGLGYCFGARVPLYVGYTAECLRAGLPLPGWEFFVDPILTDGGVRTLIWTQHLGLCAAACFIIATATRHVAVRLVLALLWALNPLFYAVAHCVGTESLSLILLLLLAGTGITLVRRRGTRRTRWLWVAFIILAALSMLTRHINGVVAALLPLAFGFACLARNILARRQSHPRLRRWLYHQAGKNARLACVAVAAGLIAISLANVTTRLVCRVAGSPYHTHVGFAFLFRLNFVDGLTPAQREPLLAQAAAHARGECFRSAGITGS